MSELHVIFQVAGTHYAVAARDVIQLESFGGATPVPGAPPWVQGLVQIRGNVVPVVDLRRRFGLPVEPPTLDSRVIVVRSDHRVVGLLADVGGPAGGQYRRISPTTMPCTRRSAAGTRSGRIAGFAGWSRMVSPSG